MKITQYILGKPFKLTLSLPNHYWKKWKETEKSQNHEAFEKILKQPQL
jgi:hypothetical protein